MPMKPDCLSIRVALASTLLLGALSPVLATWAAPAAYARSEAGSMKLLRLSVSGNRRVPTADIERAMTIHVGDRVTRAELAANMNAVIDVYRRANVGAGFKSRMTIPHPGEVLVAYMIEEQAPPPPQAQAVLRLDRVTFEGNQRIGSDAIASAITLRPGDVVDNAGVAANLRAITALYKKANIGVSITPSATYPQPNHTIVDYRIVEVPAK